MRAFVIILVVLTISTGVYSQSKNKIFYAYRGFHTEKGEVYPHLVSETDSSQVVFINNSERICFLEGLKRQNKVYQKVFTIDSILVEEGLTDTVQYIYTTNPIHRIKKWNFYSEKGVWYKSFNYTTFTYKLNPKFYPFFSLNEKMHRIGDSMLRSIFGQTIFKQNIFFNLDASSSYTNYNVVNNKGDTDWNENNDKEWLEPQLVRPNEYHLAYDIRVGNRTYEQIIRFELDASGHVILCSKAYHHYPCGLEKLSKNYELFNLSPHQAVKSALQDGMADTNKVISYLTWTAFDPYSKKPKTSVYNGFYQIWVVKWLSSEEERKSKEYVLTTHHFIVWTYSPWNGKLLAKKKMKRIDRWEGSHGGSSDLIDEQ